MALPEFDILRAQAKQRAQEQSQQTQDALKRRFSRIGGIGSGAFIKQGQVAQEQAGRQTEEAMQNIDLAQAQEQRRQDELAVERAFRERQQGFAETESQRAQKNFEEQFKQQQSQFAQQFGLTKEQAEIDRRIKEQQLQQSGDQFEIDKRTQIFNQFSAAGYSPDFLKRFLALFDSTGKIPTAQEISESLNRSNRATTSPQPTSSQTVQRTRAGED